MTATTVDPATDSLPDLDAMLAAEPAEDRPPRRLKRPSGAARRKAAAAGSPAAPAAKRAAPRPRSQTIRARKLRDVGELAATLLRLSPTTVPDAEVLDQGWAPFADATAAVAEEHPRFGVFLDGMGTGGAIGAMVLTGLAMALPIAAHHGWQPAQVATGLLGRMMPGATDSPAEGGAVVASTPLVDQFGNPLVGPPV